MAEARIKVIAHAGYRAEQSPRCFVLDGNRIDVMKVLDEWLEQPLPSRNQRRFFRVKGSDFRAHVIVYDEQLESWFHCN